MNISELKRFQLFSHLSDAELQSIISSIQVKHFKSGETIIEENKINDLIYILVTGEVGVFKIYKDKKEHYLRSLLPGRFFGEISIFEEEVSHGTVKAMNDVTVYCLKHAFFEEALKTKDFKTSVFIKLAQNIALKYKTNDDLFLIQTEQRHQLSWFLMINIALMTGMAYFLSIFRTLRVTEESSIFLTVPILVTLFIASLLYIYVSQLELKDFGIKLDKSIQSIKEAIIWSLPILILLTLLKVGLIHFSQSSLNGYNDFFNMPNKTHIYYTLFTPLQEFLIRGVMQTALERLLVGNYRVALAIIISNLVFSAFHGHLSIYYSLASLVLGLYWGLIYHRTHNLIGVSLSHMAIGLYAVGILDLDKLLKLL